MCCCYVICTRAWREKVCVERHLNVCSADTLAAIETVDRLVAAPDFDRRMLLLATKLAHDRKQKSLILVILKHLLHSLQSSQALESQVEAMTLIRFVPH